MMRSKRFLIVVMLAAMFAGSTAWAFSDDLWFGGWDPCNPDNFFVVGNWVTDGGDANYVPDPNWNANINAGKDAVIYGSPGDELGLAYAIKNLALGIGNDALNTLTVNGGNINATGPYFVVGGLWTFGQGTLTMNAGHITMEACYVGHFDTGIVNMNGGELHPWGLLKLGGAGGTGTINLDGGLVLASDLLMVNASQSIVITEGMLDVTSGAWTGDVSAKVLGYVADGWISAGTGYQLVTETYTNPASGFTGVRITAERIEGDIDGDGDVDLYDFALLANNWLSGT